MSVPAPFPRPSPPSAKPPPTWRLVILWQLVALGLAATDLVLTIQIVRMSKGLLP